METFTISVSDELKKDLKEHPEINWAEFIKKKFEEKIEELSKFEELKNSGKI